MPDVSLEQRLALITVAFLTAYRATVTLPPDTSDPAADPPVVGLPFRTSYQTGDDPQTQRPVPNVTVDCEQLTAHHNRKILKCPLTVTVETMHTDTSETDERTWVRQLRRLLSNKTLWREFLASQEEEDRAGYMIHRLNVGSSNVTIDGESEHRFLTTHLTFFVVTQELESTPA